MGESWSTLLQLACSFCELQGSSLLIAQLLFAVNQVGMNPVSSGVSLMSLIGVSTWLQLLGVGPHS